MSRRSSICSEILPYIDKDYWEKCDGFIVFGKEAFRAWGTGPLAGEELQNHEVSKEVDGFLEEFIRQQGTGLAAVRTTLDGTTRVDLTDALKDLRPKTRPTPAAKSRLLFLQRKEYTSLMQRLTFPVILESDPDGYLVSCPALQGCYSQGETYEEAMANIKDAMRLHLEDRLANGEEFPEAVSVSLSTVEVSV